MKIINVVVTRIDNDNFGIASFPILRDEDESIQAKRAEERFAEEVRANDSTISDEDMEALLDDGIYADDRTGVTVYLSWSEVFSADHADSAGRIS